MSPERPSATASSGWLGGAAARDGWGRRQGIHSPEDRRFVGLAAAALDDYLARNPIDATLVGDTRFDQRLPDFSLDGIAEQVRVLNRHLLALDSINPLGLSRVNAVDLRILRRRLTGRVFQLRTLGEPTWNPMWWTPGLALEPLVARSAVPGVLARLQGMPEHMESARHTLTDMPGPHLERALRDLTAVIDWLPGAIADLAAAHPRSATALLEALDPTMHALAEHRYWLSSRRPRAVRAYRLGERNYHEVLRLLVGSPLSVAEVQASAEAELAEMSEQLRSQASRVLGKSVATRRLVPDALQQVAQQYALAPNELVSAARRAAEAARAFTVDRQLVSVPELDLEVGPMAAVRIGGGAVFVETPGGLASSTVPTRIAVAGPDADWAPTRRASFLREYNALMMDALMTHQGFPGHALQTAHARSVTAPTAIRSVFPDPLFSEGWAVHSQDLMLDHGYAGSAPDASRAGFALQQTKLRMRGIVNALLDIGYHTREMDEPQARRLLATAAMAEEGEFVVKWHRLQLSAGMLTTYHVGQTLMADLVKQVHSSNPHWSLRQVNDQVLVNGAVPPEEAKDLLGLV